MNWPNFSLKKAKRRKKENPEKSHTSMQPSHGCLGMLSWRHIYDFIRKPNKCAYLHRGQGFICHFYRSHSVYLLLHLMCL